MTDVGVAGFPALGTTAVVVTRSGRDLGCAETAVRSEVRAVDLACSRFRDDSELVALNRAAGRWVAVGPLLLDAVEVAVRAAHQTGGAVDPTLGASLRALGYDRDFPDIEPEGPPLRFVVQARPAWSSVDVDRAGGRVRLPAGVELDLGATAKALAADRAAARAAEAVGDGVLVALGGDLAAAGPAPADGWLVRVAESHAGAPGPLDTHVRIRGGGLATSSTTVRAWRRNGTPLHHIVDPCTGRPTAGPWRTATVAAASCVDANTASTAAIVVGDGATAWLAAARLPARLVAADGRITIVGGWPEEDR